MSGLSQYLAAMKKSGISPAVVLRALHQHSSYVEKHGIPADSSSDENPSLKEYEARKYAAECRRMVEEEQARIL